MDDRIIIPPLEDGESNINPKKSSSLNRKLIEASIEEKRILEEGKKIERGFLGRIWGSIEHSSNNIAGLFIVLLLIIGFVYTICLLCSNVCDGHNKILEFWNMLSPLLTLALGYLFGKGRNS